MVLPAHGEAVTGEEAGGILIAAHVLRNSVDDLDNAAGRTGGQPKATLNLVYPVG